MSDHGRYLGVNDGRSRTGPIPARRPADDALGIVLSLRGAPPPTGWTRKQHEEALATVRDTLERQQSRIYILENMRSENYIEALESAEAEQRRLTEGLRDLREQAAPREWETTGHPMNDWTKREPILRKIDALLFASPSDGGGAK